MRLVAHFKAFMRDTVNIDDTRLGDLDGAMDAIYDALKADQTLGSLVLRKDPQGSRAHRTIIKPVDGNEFDGDFMLVLEEDEDWSEHPGRYIDELRAALLRDSTYESMVKPAKCRCVRVAYAGNFHIDVVPFVVLAGGREVIVNADEDQWEDTDPEGFTRWMKEKDDAAGGNLRLVIRLMKFLRDHGGNFKRTRSVILTALLGEQVQESNKDGEPDYYGDLPTALLHIVSDLNDWLQARPSRPSIPDPSGATDPAGVPINFDHRWTDADYLNFRSKVSDLASDIRAAYEEEEESRSFELWRKVFGADFKPPKAPGGRLSVGPVVAPTPRSVQSGRSG